MLSVLRIHRRPTFALVCLLLLYGSIGCANTTYPNGARTTCDHEPEVLIFACGAEKYTATICADDWDYTPCDDDNPARLVIYNGWVVVDGGEGATQNVHVTVIESIAHPVPPVIVPPPEMRICIPRPCRHRCVLIANYGGWNLVYSPPVPGYEVNVDPKFGAAVGLGDYPLVYSAGLLGGTWCKAVPPDPGLDLTLPPKELAERVHKYLEKLKTNSCVPVTPPKPTPKP